MKKKKFSLFDYYLLILFLVFVPVGWFMPEDVLTKNAWAAEYTDFMRGIVPSIGWVENLGVHTEINAFYQAILWPFSLLTLFVTGFALNKVLLDRLSKEGKIGITTGQILSYIFIAILIVGLALIASDFNENTKLTRVDKSVLISRFGRGVMLPSFVIGYGLAVGSILVMVWFAIMRRFKVIKKEN